MIMNFRTNERESRIQMFYLSESTPWRLFTEDPVIPILSFDESHGEIDIWLEDGNGLNLLVGSISVENDRTSIVAALSGFETVCMVLLDRTVGFKNNVIRSHDYESLGKQLKRFMAANKI